MQGPSQWHITMVRRASPQRLARKLLVLNWFGAISTEIQRGQAHGAVFFLKTLQRTATPVQNAGKSFCNIRQTFMDESTQVEKDEVWICKPHQQDENRSSEALNFVTISRLGGETKQNHWSEIKTNPCHQFFRNIFSRGKRLVLS